MDNSNFITKEYFIKRIIDLCLRSGMAGFPKDYADQLILLKSVVLTLDRSISYSEKEINEKLKFWLEQIGKIKNVDHNTLRRRLVDARCLSRNNDGSCYKVATSKPHEVIFDEAIDDLNIIEIIKAGREEIARRKREYMEKRQESNGN